MFCMILNLLQDLQPQGIGLYCDYEHAAFSAMEECFPGVELKDASSNNDPEFALKAKMIVALSFVSKSHMDDYIDVL